MGAYENPQTVITDTSSAWTNMSKVIAGNTVKYLEKRGAIRNAETKAQQKKDVEIANRLIDSRKEADRQLNKAKANEEERALYMGTLDENTKYSEDLRNAKSAEERKIALQNIDLTAKKMNSILDYARYKPKFEEDFESNNDLTARGEEGMWSVEGGFKNYGDFMNYGTGLTSGLSASKLSFDENNNLTLSIADPLDSKKLKSFKALEFITTTPPKTPKATEYVKKKLAEKGILDPKNNSKLSDEYNKMPREALEALVINEVLDPIAEGILTNPDDTQSIWTNVLKGKDRLGYPPEGSPKFPIEGSPFTSESYNAFLNTFQDWGLGNILPKNHKIPKTPAKDRVETAEEIVEEKFNNYIDELDTSWTQVTGEAASFNPKTNMLTVTKEMEDTDGNITTVPELYDLSQPGQFTNYIRLLLNKEPDLGNDIKSRKIKKDILEKARAIEPDYYSKVSPDEIKEKASQMQNIGNIDWSSPKK